MLREELQNGLKTAMLAKDTLTTNAIRMIIAGQKEKDVEARGKGQEKATDTELLSMMQGMIKQRNDSIKMFMDGHRPELHRAGHKARHLHGRSQAADRLQNHRLRNGGQRPAGSAQHWQRQAHRAAIRF